MGGSRRQPKAPAPPPVAKDESDVTAARIPYQAALAKLGFRKAFLDGPRGPGGPAWEAPEKTSPVQRDRTQTAPGNVAAPPPAGGSSDAAVDAGKPALARKLADIEDRRRR